MQQDQERVIWIVLLAIVIIGAIVYTGMQGNYRAAYNTQQAALEECFRTNIFNENLITGEVECIDKYN